jgi:hypothetical protein
MQRTYYDFYKSHEEFQNILYFCKMRVKIVL